MTDSPPTASEAQAAVIAFKAGPVDFRAEIRLTPAGVLAIGALVTGVLLSTAVIVWSATSVAREHPLASRIRPR